MAGLTFHDLRGTAVTRLALAECTEAEIAVVTGLSLSDVRDIAHCYRRLVEVSPAGECVNLCSGRAYQLAEVISELENLARYRIEIQVNPEFVRTSEVTRLAGNPERLEQLTRTKPSIPLRDTLAWMYRAPR